MAKLPRDERHLADLRDGRKFRAKTIRHADKPAPEADEWDEGEPPTP